MTAPATPTPRPGLLIILGALIAFGPMSIDMYLPSLPALARNLHGSAAGAEATVAAFFAGLAIGQLFYGPFSDRAGRRLPVLAGIGLFLVATAGCALATSIPMLIALRAVQALGGCAGVVVARAVVRDRFEARESARVFSILMLIMGVAPILAPLAGGLILQISGWRMIFWALFAFAAVTGLAVLFFLPETRSAETGARARSETPLKAYVALLSNPGVVAYTLVGAGVSSAMFTYIAASPAVVIEHFGVPAVRFGWVFGINAVGIIGASQLNHVLLHRWTSDQVLRMSTALGLLAATVLLITSATGFGGLWGVLVPLFFAVAGHGLGSPNATACALAFDASRAGSLSAVIGAAQFGLGALAAAAAGALANGTPVPMAAIICACALGAALAARLAPRLPQAN